MSDAQTRIRELHQEILEAQKKKKDLAAVIKDSHANSKEFADLSAELQQLRGKKKEIEMILRQEYAAEYNDFDDIKLDLKEMKVVLSDLMWNELMKNNNIELFDEHKNRYIPEVTVSLKKEK